MAGLPLPAPVAGDHRVHKSHGVARREEAMNPNTTLRSRASIGRAVKLALAAVMAAVAGAAVTGAVTAGAVTAGAATLPSNCRADVAQVTCTFSYNGTDGTDGSVQAFVVPAGVTQVVVEAWGAQGGGTDAVADGGLGGYASATVAVHPAAVLDLRVGGMPQGTVGGFNGGGAGGAAQPSYSAGAGGGATDIRRARDSLADRIVVAGGGGGAAFDPALGPLGGGFVNANDVHGGSGGGPSGTVSWACGETPCGAAGRAGAGGAAGAGSSCATAGIRGSGGAGCGGGGGGGYYGGGGGGYSDAPCCGLGPITVVGPGGGGSGYLTPGAQGAVDQAGLQYGDGMVRISYGAGHTRPGLVWSSPQTVDSSGGDISGVSCPSASFCMAVDSAGNAVIDRNGAWSAPVTVAAGNLAGVSCASVTFCVAVGTSNQSTSPEPLAVVYDKGTWSPNTSPIAGMDENLTGVSCVRNTKYCMAVGSFWFGGPGPSTVAQAFDGRTWTVLTGAEMAGYASGDYLSAVSCVSATFCVAGGTIGNRNDFGNLIETDNNGGWGSAKISEGDSIGAAGGVTAVVCGSTVSCLEAGPGGYVFSYAQGQWSPPADVDGGSAITGLTCPTASTCLAVDTSGGVLTDSSDSWTAPLSVDPGHSLSAVSCPRRNFCLAADTAGNIVVGS